MSTSLFLVKVREFKGSKVKRSKGSRAQLRADLLNISLLWQLSRGKSISGCEDQASHSSPDSSNRNDCDYGDHFGAALDSGPVSRRQTVRHQEERHAGFAPREESPWCILIQESLAKLFTLDSGRTIEDGSGAIIDNSEVCLLNDPHLEISKTRTRFPYAEGS
jgi:hypothetical protein